MAIKNNQPGCMLITGASSGIGEATALLAASRGYRLILLARRLDRLSKLRQSCLKAGAPEVTTLKVDVTKNESLHRLADELKGGLGASITCLVNNAGLAKGVEPIQSGKAGDWQDMFDTNVLGLLKVTQIVLPYLLENVGHIVNMGSVAGRLVYEGGGVYCATKFAVRALTEGLRMDLKGSGVRVTNVAPGMVNTEFSLVRLGNQQKAQSVYAGMMPLSANDIAETILWCVERPAHVNVQEVIIYPTDQASVGQVVRGENSILHKCDTVKKQ